jgi:hypothetical protein
VQADGFVDLFVKFPAALNGVGGKMGLAAFIRVGFVVKDPA